MNIPSLSPSAAEIVTIAAVGAEQRRRFRVVDETAGFIENIETAKVRAQGTEAASETLADAFIPGDAISRL